MDEFEELPILAVRDTVLFPNALLPLSVGRASSVALVESLGENRLIGVVSQIDPRTDVPGPADLHHADADQGLHGERALPARQSGATGRD
jgi:ATP-dependent Lon protease